MNTSASIPSASTIDIGDLHGNEPQAPVTVVPTPTATIAVGRFTPTGPTAPPRAQQPQQRQGYVQHNPELRISPLDAKRRILNGLVLALGRISNAPEAERPELLNTFLKGSSATGIIRTNRGTPVDSADSLRMLINALGQMPSAKTFDGGKRQLFFFTVPRGYAAYAGDVRVEPLVRHYQKKDRKTLQAYQDSLKRAEEAKAAGQPAVEPLREPQTYTVPVTGSKWGSWVNIIRTSTEVDFLEMPVLTSSGLKREFRPVLINTKAPLHRARTITFVLDAASGELLAWQPGRYIADMTPAQRMDRVILASGETTEEPV